MNHEDIRYLLLASAVNLINTSIAAADGGRDHEADRIECEENFKENVEAVARAFKAEDDALENIRLYASKRRREPWAQFILELCYQAGNKPSPLRVGEPE